MSTTTKPLAGKSLHNFYNSKRKEFIEYYMAKFMDLEEQRVHQEYEII
jgi:hypothetical protein